MGVANSASDVTDSGLAKMMLVGLDDEEGAEDLFKGGADSFSGVSLIVS